MHGDFILFMLRFKMKASQKQKSSIEKKHARKTLERESEKKRDGHKYSERVGIYSIETHIICNISKMKFSQVKTNERTTENKSN